MDYFGQISLLRLLFCCLLTFALSGHVLGEGQQSAQREAEEAVALPELESELEPTQSEGSRGDQAVPVDADDAPAVFVPTFQNVYAARAQALQKQKQAKERPPSAGGAEENEVE